MPNLYQDALDVQDAVNLRAIARLLVKAADAAADKGGTEASYRDPAVVLIVNKINSLVNSEERYSEAYSACLDSRPKRYAVVSAKRNSAEVIARYLPANYKIIGTSDHLEDDTFGDYAPCVVIQGQDNAGWTLDAYVLPRLGSGLILGKEIDLSHPIMRRIPV